MFSASFKVVQRVCLILFHIPRSQLRARHTEGVQELFAKHVDRSIKLETEKAQHYVPYSFFWT